MFAFDCVIEDGTYDDFKECVLAVVYLNPLPKRIEFKITSTPIVAQVRRLHARWTAEPAG